VLPAVDALKKCNDDPFVVAAVAGLFWHDRKVDKARSWFNRAVTLNPGDCLACHEASAVQALRLCSACLA
jgi:pre-mRNA-processing factor 6